MDEVEVKATPKFIRIARKMMTEESLQDLIDTLAMDPEKYDIVRGAGGIRKLRFKTGKDGGKRGGIRVLYFYNGEYIVLLITMFKKSDQENIDAGEKEELCKLVDELRGEL